MSARCYDCDSTETEPRPGGTWCRVCWDWAKSKPRSVVTLEARIKELEDDLRDYTNDEIQTDRALREALETARCRTDSIGEAARLLGWAEFNLTKGNTDAALTLIQKAQKALETK